MSATQEAVKVKLPSIAELTSSSIPSSRSDTLPLLHQHIASPPLSLSPSYSRDPSSYPPLYFVGSVSYLPEHMQPSTSHLQPTHPPSYHYHSHHPVLVSPVTFPQPYFRPMFYPPPAESAGPSRFVAIAPDQVSVFNAPEVINRPMNECHRCGTTETPEWRRGPNGLRTLCNACGLFHAKLVKRKGAALAAEEVLNNKVFKGKNGRRVCVKGHPGEVKKHNSRPQVTDFPPIAHTEHLPTREDLMHKMPRLVSHSATELPNVAAMSLPGGLLPPSTLGNRSHSVSVLQN